MPQRRVRILQLQGGYTQGPFGDRQGGQVVILPRLAGDQARPGRGLGRMCLREPERFTRLLRQLRSHCPRCHSRL